MWCQLRFESVRVDRSPAKWGKTKETMKMGNTRTRQKVLIAVTEDWFLLSHFLPLIAALKERGADVVVVTNDNGYADAISMLRVRVIQFDFRRSSVSLSGNLRTLLPLAQLINTEEPDIVHAIAMKPVAMAALASLIKPAAAICLHITGLGSLFIEDSKRLRAARKVVISVLNFVLKRRVAWLFVENLGDLEIMRRYGLIKTNRVTNLMGAGVEIPQMSHIPRRAQKLDRCIYAGRLVRQKGIHTLVEAADKLTDVGQKLRIDIYGSVDANSKLSYDSQTIESWSRRDYVTMHGHVSDREEIWLEDGIAVQPSVSREGMPRSMLEAASYSHPLVVTDVEGPNRFVRHEENGLMITPEDLSSLAESILRLANDSTLARRLGDTARRDVSRDYSVAAVVSRLNDAYDILESEVACRRTEAQAMNASA